MSHVNEANELSECILYNRPLRNDEVGLGIVSSAYFIWYFCKEQKWVWGFLAWWWVGTCWIFPSWALFLNLCVKSAQLLVDCLNFGHQSTVLFNIWGVIHNLGFLFFILFSFLICIIAVLVSSTVATDCWSGLWVLCTLPKIVYYTLPVFSLTAPWQQVYHSYSSHSHRCALIMCCDWLHAPVYL